ncbi:MAG: IS4 family transposase, partial [Flavobacteriales bacterium]
MHKGKYVFTQVLSLFNRYKFNKCVARYNGNKGVRNFSCWDQFVQMVFGQITARNGLRDICTCLNAHSEKLYHLGIQHLVHFSTLSRSNEQRDWRIFADYGYYLILLVKPLYGDESVDGKLSDELKIFALDSTTISTSIKLCSWAYGKYSKGAVKVHTLLNLKGSIPEFILITDGKCHDVNALDKITFEQFAFYVMDKAYVDFKRLYQLEMTNVFFVLRAKRNIKFRVTKSHRVDKTVGLKCDQH